MTFSNAAMVLMIAAVLAVGCSGQPSQPDTVKSAVGGIQTGRPHSPPADLIIIGLANDVPELREPIEGASTTPVELNSVVYVQEVLKGRTGSQREVSVVHYLPRSGLAQPYEFHLSAEDSSGNVIAYLLFLVRLPDGRYEPAAGQSRAYESIFKLTSIGAAARQQLQGENHEPGSTQRQVIKFDLTPLEADDTRPVTLPADEKPAR